MTYSPDSSSITIRWLLDHFPLSWWYCLTGAVLTGIGSAYYLGTHISQLAQSVRANEIEQSPLTHSQLRRTVDDLEETLRDERAKNSDLEHELSAGKFWRHEAARLQVELAEAEDFRVNAENLRKEQLAKTHEALQEIERLNGLIANGAFEPMRTGLTKLLENPADYEIVTGEMGDAVVVAPIIKARRAGGAIEIDFLYDGLRTLTLNRLAGSYPTDLFGDVEVEMGFRSDGSANGYWTNACLAEEKFGIRRKQ